MDHLLVVDDEPDILGALEAALPSFLPGVRITVATSAQEAMALVDADGFKAVLTDERMPGMTGCELLTWLRKEHPQCRRALMSAFSGPGLTRRAEAAGAELVLAKPFRLGEVAGRLTQLFEARPAA